MTGTILANKWLPVLLLGLQGLFSLLAMLSLATLLDSFSLLQGESAQIYYV